MKAFKSAIHVSSADLIHAGQGAIARRRKAHLALALGLVFVVSMVFVAPWLGVTETRGTAMLVVTGVLALVCQYVDASLGMGYGTTLTPLLLALGFSPLDAVPAVLISQLAGGLVASACHHREGNVQFQWGSRQLKTALVLGALGAAGAIIGVLTAVSLPAWILRIYIGLVVAGAGVLLLVAPHFSGRVTWGRVAGLGLVAGANKGISGGGYGPLLTAGQALIGQDPRSSVGITCLAEVVVCVVAFAMFLISGRAIHVGLLLALVAGSVLSAPLSAWTVRNAESRALRFAIAAMTIFLGGAAIVTGLLGL